MVLPTLDEKRPVVPPLETDPLLPPPNNAATRTSTTSNDDRPNDDGESPPSSSAPATEGSTKQPARNGNEVQEGKEDAPLKTGPDGNEAGAASDENHDDDDSQPRGRLASWAGSVQEGAASLVEALVGAGGSDGGGSTTIAHMVLESAEHLHHNLLEQVGEVVGALRDELQQVDDDGMFFLEMGLARNLSILPADVVDVAAAAASTNLMVAAAAAVETTEEGEEEIEGKIPLEGEVTVDGSALFAAGEEHDDEEEEELMLSSQLLPPPISEDLEQSVEFLAGLTRQFSFRRSSSILSSTTTAATPSVKPPLSVAGDEVTTVVEAERFPDVVVVVPPPHPINAYLLLATAVVSLSSIGPFLQLQHDCTSAMKVTWRTCGTACLLLPFCAMEVVRYGYHPLTVPQLLIFLFSTISYVVMVLGFVLALQYTAVGNAVILSNSQALLLLVGKLMAGTQVTALEGSGALTAFCGAVLCSLDSAATATAAAADDDAADVSDSTAFQPSITFNDDVIPAYGLHRVLGSDDLGGVDDRTARDIITAPSSSASTLTGDAYALLSGVGGVGYLVFAKAVRAHLKLYTFMFATMAVACALCVAAQVLVLHETVTLDFDVNHGLFGFLTPVMDRLYVEVLIVAVCNMLGTLGYVRAMQYFDNLVISVAALMEPVVAELMAAVMGVSTLPGPMGWLGNALVAIGTFAVVYPTPGKSASSSH